jgi:hypothetical protein
MIAEGKIVEQCDPAGSGPETNFAGIGKSHVMKETWKRGAF